MKSKGKKRTQKSKEIVQIYEQQVQEPEKKVKNENGNSQAIKDAIMDLQVKIIEDIDEPKQQIDEFLSAIEEIKSRLKDIQAEKHKLETRQRIDNGGLNEKKFSKEFKQSLSKQIIKCINTDQLDHCQYNIDKIVDYTSTLLPKGSKIQHEINYAVTNYEHNDIGFNRIYYVDKDGEKIVLQDYEVYEDNYRTRLAVHIKEPEYDEDYIHKENINKFISDVLGLKNLNNINTDKLIDQLCDLFYDMQDDNFGYKFEVNLGE